MTVAASPTTEASAPDVTDYLRIHRCLRHGAADLAAAARRLRTEPQLVALSRWYRGFAGEIRCHHHIEDELVFPALRAKLADGADYARYGDRLDADHHQVDELLDGITAAFRRQDRPAIVELTDGLRRHLDEHLGYEDDEIVPLFVQHFSAAEFEAIHQGAVKMTPPRQLLFTVPWALCQLDAHERDDTLADVPPVVRLVWRATRRRYVRLHAAAFAPIR